MVPALSADMVTTSCPRTTWRGSVSVSRSARKVVSISWTGTTRTSVAMRSIFRTAAECIASCRRTPKKQRRPESENNVRHSAGRAAEAYKRLVRTARHARFCRREQPTGRWTPSLVHSQLEQQLQTCSDHPQTPSRIMGAACDRGAGVTVVCESCWDHQDEYVRGWTIQFLCDESSVNAFQDASQAPDSPPSQNRFFRSFAARWRRMSSHPIVRLYLASAAQRLPFSDRWSILEGPGVP